MRRSLIKLKDFLPKLIGRKITKVLYTEPEYESSSPSQFLIELDNGITFEIYGSGSLEITGFDDKRKRRCRSSFKNAETNKLSAVLADGKDVKVYEYK